MVARGIHMSQDDFSRAICETLSRGAIEKGDNFQWVKLPPEAIPNFPGLTTVPLCPVPDRNPQTHSTQSENTLPVNSGQSVSIIRSQAAVPEYTNTGSQAVPGSDSPGSGLRRSSRIASLSKSENVQKNLEILDRARMARMGALRRRLTVGDYQSFLKKPETNVQNKSYHTDRVSSSSQPRRLFGRSARENALRKLQASYNNCLSGAQVRDKHARTSEVASFRPCWPSIRHREPNGDQRSMDILHRLTQKHKQAHESTDMSRDTDKRGGHTLSRTAYPQRVMESIRRPSQKRKPANESTDMSRNSNRGGHPVQRGDQTV
eukprot:458139_1